MMQRYAQVAELPRRRILPVPLFSPSLSSHWVGLITPVPAGIARPLVESLRTLRLMHHAAWLAARWHDPAFPRYFPWFNTPRYWSEHILELREQLAALDEEPLALQRW